MMVRGSVDLVTADEVHGWAFGPDRKLPVKVQAVLNGEVLGEATAQNFRGDLREAGLGDGRSGFVISLSRALDPLYLPFVAVKLNGGDAELPRVPRLGTMEFLSPLYRAYPAVGRHRSVLGGLWTDRTDAGPLLSSKVEIGQIAVARPAVAALIEDGFAVIAAAAAAMLHWHEDPAGAAESLLGEAALAEVLRAVLEDRPLAVNVEWAAVGEGFSQPSARNPAPSPAECLEILVPVDGAGALDVIRCSHALPEYAPHGESRWTARGVAGALDDAAVAGSLDRITLRPGEACLIGPGTIYRAADGDVARVRCLPARCRPFGFTGLAAGAGVAGDLVAAG